MKGRFLDLITGIIAMGDADPSIPHQVQLPQTIPFWEEPELVPELKSWKIPNYSVSFGSDSGVYLVSIPDELYRDAITHQAIKKLTQ